MTARDVRRNKVQQALVFLGECSPEKILAIASSAVERLIETDDVRFDDGEDSGTPHLYWTRDMQARQGNAPRSR